MRIHRLTAYLLILCTLLCLCSCKKESIKPTTSIVPTDYEFDFNNPVSSFTADIYSNVDYGKGLIKKQLNIEFDSEKTPLNALIETVVVQDCNEELSWLVLDYAIVSDRNICYIFFVGDGEAHYENWINLEGMLFATLKDFVGIKGLCLFLNGSVLTYENGLPITVLTDTEFVAANHLENRLDGLMSENSSSVLCFMPMPFMEFDTAMFEQIKKCDMDAKDSLARLVNKILELEQESITGFKFEYDAKVTKSGTVKLSVQVENQENNDYVLPHCKMALVMSLLTNLPGIKAVTFTDDPSIKYKLSNMYSIFSSRYTQYLVDLDNELLLKGPAVCKAEDIHNYRQLIKNAVENDSYGYRLLNFDLKVDQVVISKGVAAVCFEKGTKQQLLDKYINAKLDGEAPSQEMILIRERLFVYSIVNTLTEFPHINSVMFFEGGKPITKLVSIHLNRPLYSNPGLVG